MFEKLPNATALSSNISGLVAMLWLVAPSMNLKTRQLPEASA